MNKWDVNLRHFKMGDDLVLMLQGGEKPHIGAVALALPYENTASASLIAVPNHKDGDLAKPLSEKVAKELRIKVILIVGIHIEDASHKDLEKVINNSEIAIDEFIKKNRDKI